MGSLDHMLLGGGTSFCLTPWRAGKCSVWGVPKMQTLPQKCPSLGSALDGQRAQRAGAGTARGEVMCPGAHGAAGSEEGKSPWGVSHPPPPKESGLSGSPRREHEGTGAAARRGGRGGQCCSQHTAGVTGEGLFPSAPPQSPGRSRLFLLASCDSVWAFPASFPGRFLLPSAGAAYSPPRASPAAPPGQSLLPSAGAAYIPPGHPCLPPRLPSSPGAARLLARAFPPSLSGHRLHLPPRRAPAGLDDPAAAAHRARRPAPSAAASAAASRPLGSAAPGGGRAGPGRCSAAGPPAPRRARRMAPPPAGAPPARAAAARYGAGVRAGDGG